MKKFKGLSTKELSNIVNIGVKIVGAAGLLLSWVQYELDKKMMIEDIKNDIKKEGDI